MPVSHRVEARERSCWLWLTAFVPCHYLLRCPQHLANFEDGVNFTGPREEWPEGVHFRHDAAYGPDVNGGAVVSGPQEHLWSPVPGETKGNCWYCFHWPEVNQTHNQFSVRERRHLSFCLIWCGAWMCEDMAIAVAAVIKQRFSIPRYFLLSMPLQDSSPQQL